MTNISKNSIIFFAEYAVVVPGILLLLASLQANSLVEEVHIFVTGSILLLTALFIARVLKIVIKKKRPPQEVEFFTPGGIYAFPSGHATGLASVTLFIIMQNVVLGLFAGIISLLIMRARVKAHVHDGYDMIAGVCVGGLTTYLLASYVSRDITPYLMAVFL